MECGHRRALGTGRAGSGARIPVLTRTQTWPQGATQAAQRLGGQTRPPKAAEGETPIPAPRGKRPQAGRTQPSQGHALLPFRSERGPGLGPPACPPGSPLRAEAGAGLAAQAPPRAEGQRGLFTVKGGPGRPASSVARSGRRTTPPGRASHPLEVLPARPKPPRPAGELTMAPMNIQEEAALVPPSTQLIIHHTFGSTELKNMGRSGK